MSSPARREAELDRDVKVLKGILYDLVEKSIIFQQQVKEQMPRERRARRALMRELMKVTNVQDILFFNPREFIEKCFDKERTVNLAKLREIRGRFTQLAINMDKVTVALSSGPEMAPSRQMEILEHLLDGLNAYAREQRKSLKKLQRKLSCSPEKLPTSLAIEGLSKARIMCTFYIKWLTTADNEYTDREIAKAGVKARKDFGSELTKNLDAISRAELFVLADNLNNRLDTIEQKMDLHSQESKLNQELIRSELGGLTEVCTSIAQKYPDEIKLFVDSKANEIKELLLNVEKSLKDIDSINSRRARTLKSRLERGIGTAADLVQLFSFIVGIPSLPALFGSGAAIQAFKIIRNFGKKFQP